MSIPNDKRQRFHGAFTGGFSAGYFNTVGSAEGFKPAQFVSSKSNRAVKVFQSVTDYMDAEDGLLNGQLSTKKDLDSFISSHSTSATIDDPILAKLAKQFVLEPSNTIGKKMLSKLGWKPGMAIGPRKKKSDYFDDPEVAKMVLQSGKIPANSLVDGQIAFSAKYEGDLVPKMIKPWTGFYGVGYDPTFDTEHRTLRTETGFDESSNRYHVRDLFDGTKKPGVVSKDARNRGGGKYMDDDEDIAFLNDEDHYTKEVQDDAFGAFDRDKFDRLSYISSREDYSGRRDNAFADKVFQRCPTDDKPVLPGFVLATNISSAQFPQFPPPEVPRDFRPRPHLLFTSLEERDGKTVVTKDLLKRFDQRIDAFSNNNVPQTVALEPVTSATPSVFDLLKPADRERILQLAQKNGTAVTTKESETGADKRPMLVSPALLQNPAFTSLAASFKSRFTSATEATAKSQQQAQEAAQLQAGMLSAQAFKEQMQRSQVQSSDVQIHRENSNSSTPLCKPRRSEVPWAPSSLLCKRMNVKIPNAASFVAAESQSLIESSIKAVPPNNQSKNVPVEELSEANRARFQAEDVYLQPSAVTKAPSSAVFKSIFDSSSDEEDDSDDSDTESNYEEKRTLHPDNKISAGESQAGAHSMITIPQTLQQATPKTEQLSPPQQQENENEQISTAAVLPTFVPRSQRTTSQQQPATAAASSIAGIVGLLPIANRPKGKTLPKNTKILSQEGEEDDDGVRFQFKKPSYTNKNRDSSTAAVLQQKNIDRVGDEDENISEGLTLLHKRRTFQQHAAGGIGISQQLPAAKKHRSRLLEEDNDDIDK